MTSNHKGNVGLAKVLTELTCKGMFCFLPFTDTTCVDLIVANQNMKTLRVQVKHKKITNGCINVKCASVINGKTILLNKEHIDYFMVYCPDNSKIYYLPIEVFGENYNFKLRIDVAKFKISTVNNAVDYETFNF